MLSPSVKMTESWLINPYTQSFQEAPAAEKAQSSQDTLPWEESSKEEQSAERWAIEPAPCKGRRAHSPSLPLVESSVVPLP